MIFRGICAQYCLPCVMWTNCSTWFMQASIVPRGCRSAAHRDRNVPTKRQRSCARMHTGVAAALTVVAALLLAGGPQHAGAQLSDGGLAVPPPKAVGKAGAAPPPLSAESIAGSISGAALGTVSTGQSSLDDHHPTSSAQLGHCKPAAISHPGLVKQRYWVLASKAPLFCEIVLMSSSLSSVWSMRTVGAFYQPLNFAVVNLSVSKRRLLQSSGSVQSIQRCVSKSSAVARAGLRSLEDFLSMRSN